MGMCVCGWSFASHFGGGGRQKIVCILYKNLILSQQSLMLFLHIIQTNNELYHGESVGYRCRFKCQSHVTCQRLLLLQNLTGYED
jgi:hypothetical protein